MNSTQDKAPILVLIPAETLWQIHLFASLEECFTVHIIYINEKINELGNFDLFTKYIKLYLEHTKISIIFFDIERFCRFFNMDENDFSVFFSVIGSKRLFPFFFDDIVFRNNNINTIKKLKFEKILTACPLSALKYRESMHDAAFFPLEGHNKWYFSKPDQMRDIDILFYGTLKKGDRKEQLSVIKNAGLNVTHIGGGKRLLSCEQLCDYIRRSKIVLNFSKSCPRAAGATRFLPDGEIYYQFKGRILETGFCGTLCVSESNPPADILFGNALPQFTSTNECIDILKSLLQDNSHYENLRKNFVDISEQFRPVTILKSLFKIDPNSKPIKRIPDNISNINLSEYRKVDRDSQTIKSQRTSSNHIQLDINKNTEPIYYTIPESAYHHKQPIKIIYQNHGATGIHVADILTLIRDGLTMAGYHADIERNFVPGHTNILLENFNDEFTDQLLQSLDLGTQFIIVATEFLTSGTFNHFGNISESLTNAHYGKPNYWKIRHRNFMRLAKHALAVWHLCEHQTNAYQQALPDCRIGYLPHGYVPTMQRVMMKPKAERNIDFLFTGTLTEHRQSILENLETRGFRVMMCPPTTAHFHREDLVARTRIALNLRQNADWPYPSNSRLHYHLINQSFLMTERCSYSCDLDAYVAHSENIIEDAIERLSQADFDERARESLEKFAIERPMGPLMAALMHDTLSCDKQA